MQFYIASERFYEIGSIEGLNEFRKKLIPYKNIFLDRDGIINNIIMRDEIVSSPRTLDEFQFTDHIFEFVEYLHKEKRNFCCFLNQPDIARKKWILVS